MTQNTTKTFTANDVEIAQCLWECVIDSFRQVEPDPTYPETDAILDCLDIHGTIAIRAAMRTPEVIEMARTGWDMLTDDLREMMMPFDWNYIPFVVHHCINWNPNSFFTGRVKPNWRSVIIDAAVAAKKEETERFRRGEAIMVDYDSFPDDDDEPSYRELSV